MAAASVFSFLGILITIPLFCLDVLPGHVVHALSIGEIPDEALPTFSGYLPVNNVTGAKIYYVYYEAQSPEGQLADTPIVLWLQGGPGCSGLIGNLFELGPWVIGEDEQFHPNTGTWNRIYGLLFIDQPVGTGFSVAPSPADVPQSDEATSRDIFLALEGFYTRHSFQTRPLYITGESYAGKYIPGIGYYVLQQTAAGAITPSFDLKGLAIGNGLTDPVLQIPVYPPAAFYMGLIDWHDKQAMDKLADLVVTSIQEGRWDVAHAGRSNLMRSLYNLSGLATLLDIRRPTDYYTFSNGNDWLSPVVNSPSFKKAMGVEDTNVTWEDCTDYVDEAFRNQTMKSTKYMVEAILPHIPVLLYQGQFDLQDGVASNEAWMRHIDWTEIAQFWSTPRKLWIVDGETVGYVRTHETLAHVVLLGAGHLVPADQGVRSQKMLEAWINGSLGTLSDPDVDGEATAKGRMRRPSRRVQRSIS